MAEAAPAGTPAAPRPANGPVILHGYFRSAASWRVRIALALKGVPVRPVSHHLRRGDQRSPAYLALNPQGLVPALELPEGTVLTQSAAILEWLEETVPTPPLLPSGPVQRARVRAFAQVLTADTHPLQNLGVLAQLRAKGWTEPDVQGWAADVNRAGLRTCQALLPAEGGPFCFGAQPGLADICLVPQMGNARRFGVDVSAFPRLVGIEAACLALPAFADAVPARQPDAE